MRNLTKISLLIDFYGRLLTKRQYQYLMDYYFDDFSLQEIAETYNVSRNAIYDSLRKAEHQLERYENNLKMIKNYLKRRELYEKIEDKELKEKLLKTEMVSLWIAK